MEDNPELHRAPEPAAPIYFYHPDHLGTSTFLTDANGVAYQFFLNLPFGETMAEQYPSSYYKTPFKFSGKELDEETGLHYFGARYYDSRSSIWLSVDPLAEKFPNWNPYNYTMQNPINLVDPTGMYPEGTEGNPPSGTYVILYGSPWDNPESKSGNQGDNFKLNAEAQKQNLLRSGVPENSIILKQVTKQEFLDIVNQKHSSGEIVQMDIYSHSYTNGINFGGDAGMEPPPNQSTISDKAYRLLFNSDISKIDSNNFSKDSNVTIWGCNAGAKSDKAETISQVLVNHLNRGGNNDVKALDSYSEHKVDKNGKIIFDGTMIRTRDRRSQKVNLTTFKPK